MSAFAKFREGRTHASLMKALIDARARFGGNTVILEDEERQLTYNDVLKAAFALARPLTEGTVKGQPIGLLMPTSVGGVVAFLAIHAAGRVPAILNFTAGAASLMAACEAAQITQIITARRFLDEGGYWPLISHLACRGPIIHLDDVRETLTVRDKIRALRGRYAPWSVRARPKWSDAATILFTSGTEGDPKGVVLTHANLIANAHQIRAHIPELTNDDVMFNPLPIFHSLGLSSGTLMPMLTGLKTVLYPSPLRVKEIPKRVRESEATVILTTDTFITQYARSAADGDLSSLRLTVCGAERVRDETRALLRRKFDIELYEGYGATEASPVICVNSPTDNRPGAVGRMLPEIEHKLEPVEGLENCGRLLVRGPNVMKGYLRPTDPGVIEKPTDGWHDTGDVVSIDDDGVVRILGRVKRFAKIGGEMVSLAVVENCATSLWPDHLHAAASVPDPRKGEQIILITENEAANRPDFLAFAQNHGVSELAVPRRVLKVEQVPVLGTGKIDYAGVDKLVRAGLDENPPDLPARHESTS